MIVGGMEEAFKRMMDCSQSAPHTPKSREKSD